MMPHFNIDNAEHVKLQHPVYISNPTTKDNILGVLPKQALETFRDPRAMRA